ncbi:hypothetical protein ACF0H5_009845 [Mactra antiquata]
MSESNTREVTGTKIKSIVDKTGVGDDNVETDIGENGAKDVRVVDENYIDADKNDAIVHNRVNIPRKKNQTKKYVNNTPSEKSGINMSYLKSLMNKYRDLYHHQVVYSIKNTCIFYISAVVSHNNLVGTFITLNGWKDNKGDKNIDIDLYCCLQAQDYTEVFKVAKVNILDVSNIKVLAAAQYICNVNSTISQSPDLKVGLALSNTSCKGASYVKADREEIPDRKSPSMAICGKILYDDFPAERVLEWLELNRIQGVDKIVLFTSNITKNTKKVLQHYVEEGFLVVKEFDFPLKCEYTNIENEK